MLMQERLWYNYSVINVFCGEDSIAARLAYNRMIDKYRKCEAEIVVMSASSIMDLKQGVGDNINMFAQQTVFCMENLEKAGFKKSTKVKADKMYEAIVSLAQDKSIVILDFEDSKQGRQLKLKDIATIHESKPAISIFSLVESCNPGNKNGFIQWLQTVCLTQDEQFVFIMLYRHIRLLVLAQNSDSSFKLPPWQKSKVLAQARNWDKKALLDFYAGLIKIEITSKTSTNPFGIRKSLEILSCYYL